MTILVDMSAFRIPEHIAREWLRDMLNPDADRGHSHQWAIVLLDIESGNGFELHQFESPCPASNKRAHLATVIAALRDTADELADAHADILQPATDDDPVVDENEREVTNECGPCPPHVLRDLLLLVGVTVHEDTVHGWTLAERAEAERWASATHLAASDNDVDVPPRPLFLQCRDGKHVDDCDCDEPTGD